MSKILERLILKILQTNLEENDILIDEQYGFRPNHSKTLQLAKLLDDINIGHHNLKNTLLVTLDVKKALDSVWNDRLIHKLMMYRFPTQLKLFNHFWVEDSSR